MKYRNSHAARGLAAGLLGAALVFPSFSVAAEAKTIVGSTSSLNVADIKPDAVTKLTVILPKVSGQAVSGISFTLQRIDAIDLTTTAGWDKAVALSDEQAAQAPSTLTVEKSSDSNGRVVFENLPIGVFRVVENPGQNRPDGYRPTKPMVITLPVGDTDNAQWIYSVEITAKGQPVEPPVTTPPEKPDEPGNPFIPLIPVLAIIPFIPLASPTPVPPPPLEKPTTSAPRVLSQAPEEIPRRKGIPKLPNTGANVGYLAIAGLLMFIAGAGMLRRRRV